MIRRARGLGTTDQVAQAIQTIEGWFPGSIAYRNNNPGNLRPAGQPGCTSVSTSSGQFCSFPDYQSGYQALINQINLDASRGLSIADFTSKYAPASDANDPKSYAASLAKATGLSVSDPLAAALDSSSDYAYVGEDTSGGQDLSGLYWGIGALALGAILFAVV